MSNQLCYVFRESNPIIRHKTLSYIYLGFRVEGLGFGAWAPIGKSLTRIYPVQSYIQGSGFGAWGLGLGPQ